MSQVPILTIQMLAGHRARHFVDKATAPMDTLVQLRVVATRQLAVGSVCRLEELASKAPPRMVRQQITHLDLALPDSIPTTRLSSVNSLLLRP